MAVYRLQIAGIRICISTERNIEIGENFLPFLVDYSENEDENIIIKSTEVLPSPDYEPRWNSLGDGYTSLCGEPYILHRLPDCKEPFSADIVHERSREILFLRNSYQLPFSLQKVFNGLPFEGLLLRYGCIILHSAFIRYNGKAILFSAPSGTGKSTQASLWEKYEGAEIINGDRAALRKIDGIWRAFGIPLAGSSNIFRNESASVKALVLLKQDKINMIKKLDAFQAFRMVYPEFALFREDRERLQQGTDIILDFLENVPAYCLSCRPERESVELLLKTLSAEV